MLPLCLKDPLRDSNNTAFISTDVTVFEYESEWPNMQLLKVVYLYTVDFTSFLNELC